MASGWWVDAGNAENYGQILIGNTDRAIFDGDTYLGLPVPTLQEARLPPGGTAAKRLRRYSGAVPNNKPVDGCPGGGSGEKAD